MKVHAKINLREIATIADASVLNGLIGLVNNANEQNRDLVQMLLDGVLFGDVCDPDDPDDADDSCDGCGGCDGCDGCDGDPGDIERYPSEHAADKSDVDDASTKIAEGDKPTESADTKVSIPRVEGADPSSPEFQGTCYSAQDSSAQDNTTPDGAASEDGREAELDERSAAYEEVISALWDMYVAGDAGDYVSLTDIPSGVEDRMVRFLNAKRALAPDIRNRLFPRKDA